ncbi:AraC family transcriptional regulator [Celerinatantimonas sp. MCCC 1A17872]
MTFTDIEQILRRFIQDSSSLEQVEYAKASKHPPALAYQEDFPRLELVISGQVHMSVAGEGSETHSFVQTPKMVLFIPKDGWNKANRDQPVQTLSLLFGKQRLGFSIMQYNAQQLISMGKYHVLRRGPRTTAFMLQSLSELSMQQSDQQTALLLVRAVLSSVLDLLHHPIENLSRSKALFEAIRNYIGTHYQSPMTRETLAQAFYISPSYLSHLFRKEANVSFYEYLNYVRLEHAKELLKHYDLKVKEIAMHCGFNDSNYFCRLFKQQTRRSPSQYRVHYHSLQQ